MEKEKKVVTDLPEELHNLASQRGWTVERDSGDRGMMQGMPHTYWTPPKNEALPEESARIAKEQEKKKANSAEADRKSKNKWLRNTEEQKRIIKEEEVARCRAIVKEADATPRKRWWGGRKTRRRHTKRRSTRSKRSNA